MFTMTLQKAVYATGEPVNITFTVTNISNQNMTIVRWAYEFDFVVYDRSNSGIYQWSRFKAFIEMLWWVFLDPGDSFESVLVWPQTWNQTDRNNEGIPVSSGIYSIVGLWNDYETGPLRVFIVEPIVEPNPSPAIVIVGLAVAMPVVILVAAVLVTKKR
jgi:hypothetical protein